jgi:hypothetical protein
MRTAHESIILALRRALLCGAAALAVACGGGSDERDTGTDEDAGGGGSDIVDEPDADVETPEVGDEPDVEGPDEAQDVEPDIEVDAPVAPRAEFNAITAGGSPVASGRFFGIVAIGAPGPTTGALSPRFEVNVVPGSVEPPAEGSAP